MGGTNLKVSNPYPRGQTLFFRASAISWISMPESSVDSQGGWLQTRMSDTTTAYLVSLGIIGAGAIWIDAGTTLCIAIGVPTIAVGLISLLAELRN